MKKIYLTGIKPTGNSGMHLGNYFGIISQIKEIAKDKNNIIYLMLADLHSLTTIHDRNRLIENKKRMLKELFSFFWNYENVIIYEQSKIKDLLHINWILGSVTGFGLINRGHAFKDAKEKGKDINMALFNYPLLMASDILSLDIDIIPIGRDQKQHIEFTRDIAYKFNSTYKTNLLKLPDFQFNKSVDLLKGIDGLKMSKSYNNVINIFDGKNKIKKQIMHIKTDDIPLNEPKNPENCLVYYFIKLFGDNKKINENYKKGGYGYGHAKYDFLDILLNFFNKEREFFFNINEDEIIKKLDYNNNIVNNKVTKKYIKIKNILGL